VLSALAVLVTFKLALSVLNMQLSFNLGLVDALAHLLDVKLQRRALLGECLHLFLELFCELLDLLVLITFLFLKLSEPLLVLQLGTDGRFKLLKLVLLFLFFDDQMDDFNQIVFVLLDHFVVACNVRVLMQLAH
jgi:hypothetical protein